MDKQAALERLTALEKEATRLREILEEEGKVPSLLPVIVAGSGIPYYQISNMRVAKGLGATHTYYAMSFDKGFYEGNAFQSREVAEAYGEAINTMLHLRQQPGTVVPEDKDQFAISIRRISLEPYVITVTTREFKSRMISPSFASKELAEKAIRVVGAEKIKHMFKTLHHLGGEYV